MTASLMADELLRATDVSFRYSQDSSPVLSGLSLTLLQGRKIAVVGRSGTGKTTLLSLLAGFLAPTTGRIGRQRAIDLRQGGKIGLVPQKDSLFPWKTVLDNLALTRSEKTGQALERIRGAVSDVGLPLSSLDAFPQSLSVGMRKRVEVVRAGLSGSKMLLADEPFSALDQASATMTRDWLFRQVERQRSALVLVSHDLIDAVRFADELIVFSKAPSGTVKVVRNLAAKLPVHSSEAESFRVEIAKEMGII